MSLSVITYEQSTDCLAIQDILVSIKPNLTKRIQDADGTLLAPLDDIAVLCEKFLLERPRNKESAQFTDALDREGVLSHSP